jgi:hypothetical protein
MLNTFGSKVPLCVSDFVLFFHVQSGRNLNNFKHAVRRLDEVALNAREEERKQALTRWLGALKDIDKETKSPLKRAESISSQSDGSASPKSVGEEEPGFSPRRASMVSYHLNR